MLHLIFSLILIEAMLNTCRSPEYVYNPSTFGDGVGLGIIYIAPIPSEFANKHYFLFLQVGTMNERLPTEVSFTILSGDKGFREVERQMRKCKRRVMVIDPHNAATISSDMIYALVTSVTET